MRQLAYQTPPSTPKSCYFLRFSQLVQPKSESSYFFSLLLVSRSQHNASSAMSIKYLRYIVLNTRVS
jgi:hypothetical protein